MNFYRAFFIYNRINLICLPIYQVIKYISTNNVFDYQLKAVITRVLRKLSHLIIY